MPPKPALAASPTRQLHHQTVAEDLLAQIREGTFAVGDRLPTEGELCATYGLARGTVRQALGRLQQLGMIERRPGAGTTVVATRPVGPYQPFASSPSDIAELAASTRLTRPEAFEVVLDAELAKRLGARLRTKWHVLRGVRVRRDQPDLPLCWSEHYNRGEPVARNHNFSFAAEDLADCRVEQLVSAAALDPEVAARLGAEPGGPALVVQRRISDRRGRLINVGIYTHPADRYQIATVLSSGR
jgi:GntR family transcriptional regulator